jgi:ABC-type phosphate/phosphonate transport system permease subunit|tara:strand:+ start:549 stop:740 length:192 start_codon:yes stop_codon:yes gene_type:complete
MNDTYKLNKPSGQPMATRNIDSIAFEATVKNDDWLDRLITSMYIVLTGTLFSISLAVLLGFST